MLVVEFLQIGDFMFFITNCDIKQLFLLSKVSPINKFISLQFDFVKHLKR